MLKTSVGFAIDVSPNRKTIVISAGTDLAAVRILVRCRAAQVEKRLRRAPRKLIHLE